MSRSVIWFRQIGTINLSSNAFARKFDTHRYTTNSVCYPGQVSPCYRILSRVKIHRKKGAVACAAVGVILLQVASVGNISLHNITLRNIRNTM